MGKGQKVPWSPVQLLMRGGRELIIHTGPTRRKYTHSDTHANANAHAHADAYSLSLSASLTPSPLSVTLSLLFHPLLSQRWVRLCVWKNKCIFTPLMLCHLFSYCFPPPLSSPSSHRLVDYWKSMRYRIPDLKSNFVSSQINANSQINRL